MKTITICLTLLGGTLAGALGDTKISSYHAMFSKKDFVSSNDTKLSGTAAAVQQDRANYYKFKNKDQTDTGSGFFTTAARRGQIPAMLKRGGVSNKLISKPDTESLWKVTIMQNSNGEYYLTITLIAG